MEPGVRFLIGFLLGVILSSTIAGLAAADTDASLRVRLQRRNEPPNPNEP